MKNLFPFLLLFLTTIVNAAEPQTLIIKENDAVDYYSLGQKSILLEDENHELSFEDVNKGLIEEKGIQLTEEISNLDLTTSAYWVKFSIKNESSETKRFHLEVARPVTNKADLYIVRKNDEMKIIKHGDGLPFDNREIRHRKIIFPIVLKPNEENTCYLNLASDGEVITLPIKLWNTDALEERDYAEQFTFGIYFGILLFVIIIYFFFFIALRDKSFKYYVLYVASLLLMQFSIDGLAFQYFWPFSPWIGNHAVLIFSCLTILFVLKYAQAFMKIKDNLPVYNKIFNVFILLSAICVALSFTSGTLYSFVFPAANVLGFLSTIFILATIFACSRKQIHISGFFTAAFVALIIGAILFILGNFNLVENNIFSEHGLKFGSAFEVIFLSLTMANKYREIQQEKEDAQAESIYRLEEINKMKEDQNIELERQVKERTAEVVHQKEELEEKNKEIMDSINYAKGIQDAILPPDEFIEEYLPDSFVLFKPKDVVSGDFYWMEKKDSKLFFAAVDCTGHGVPGAFVSMVGANGLHRCLKEHRLTEPAKILDKLTELVEETFRQRKDGMDIALCALEMKNGKGKLDYAGANNSLYFIRNGELHETKPDKQPIGAYDHRQSFTNHTTELQKDDTIYVFSDGYPDQFGGPKGKKFKYRKLRELLLSIQDKTMNEQKEILDHTIEDWMGDEHEQIDDICIIGVRI